MTAPDPSRIEAIAIRIKEREASLRRNLCLALANDISIRPFARDWIAVDPATARLAELEWLLAECRAAIVSLAALTTLNDATRAYVDDLCRRLGGEHG